MEFMTPIGTLTKTMNNYNQKEFVTLKGVELWTQCPNPKES